MWFFGEEDEKNSVSGSRLSELSEGRSVGGLEGRLEVWKSLVFRAYPWEFYLVLERLDC